MEAPDGKIGHAELEIGDSLVMLSDPMPQATALPLWSVATHVEDVPPEEMAERAKAAMAAMAS